jgi:hypothetical protein
MMEPPPVMRPASLVQQAAAANADAAVQDRIRPARTRECLPRQIEILIETPPQDTTKIRKRLHF